jgi:NAD(P)-dependent dehydrogenase (short-subunit alcohol dehydrogenase family)
MLFEDTYIVITGGSKGIGKTLAKRFFEEGASIVICSRNQEELHTTCHEIDSEGVRCFGILADVSLAGDCKKVIDFAVEKFGSVDVLINNAGIIGETGKFLDADIPAWEQAIMVNLFGTAACTRAVLPYMKQAGRGKIINFAGAGVGSKNPLPHLSSYYTSKIAIAGFTETIAAELVEENIQINCIAPGAINTNITEYLLAQGKNKIGEDMYKRTLKQKEDGGDSEEKIFDLVSFLASEASDAVSGRLLSSKWDSIEMLKTLDKEGDMFKLRRIDNELFYGAKK